MMTNLTIGYLYAIISSIFFALYVVPKKLTNQKPILFSFFIALGFLFGSIILYLISILADGNAEMFSGEILIFSAFAGILWAVGTVFLLSSIDHIGLARSNQWKNLQGPIGVFLSLILLSEFLQTNAFLATLAGFAIFISAIFFTIKHPEETHIEPKGIMFAILSSFMFGSVTVLNKFVTNLSAIYIQLVIWSFFTFVSISIYIGISRVLRNELMFSSKKEVRLGLLGGLLYSLAGFLMLQSYSYIPASIAFTVIQLNTLWVIAIGIIFFKEIDCKKNALRILAGIIFAISGMAFLYFAKNN